MWNRDRLRHMDLVSWSNNYKKEDVMWPVHKRAEKGSGTDELTEQTGPGHQRRYAKETGLF